jgi:hypothetical protein
MVLLHGVHAVHNYNTILCRETSRTFILSWYIHRTKFADFTLDLCNCYSQSRIYIGVTQTKYRFVKSIVFLFGGELGCFLVCLTVKENVGMPENHRFMMDYQYHEKNMEIYLLKYILYSFRNLDIMY